MDEETEVEAKSPSGLPAQAKIGIGLVASALIGVVIITTTRQPGLGGPIAILFFLALIFLGSIGLFLILAELIFRSFSVKRFSSLRVFYTSVLVSMGTVFLLGLQTLGQLQLVDIVLVAVFEVLLNFYLLRRF